jgi:hypothetical protein
MDDWVRKKSVPDTFLCDKPHILKSCGLLRCIPICTMVCKSGTMMVPGTSPQSEEPGGLELTRKSKVFSHRKH